MPSMRTTASLLHDACAWTHDEPETRMVKLRNRFEPTVVDETHSLHGVRPGVHSAGHPGKKVAVEPHSIHLELRVNAQRNKQLFAVNASSQQRSL